MSLYLQRQAGTGVNSLTTSQSAPTLGNGAVAPATHKEGGKPSSKRVVVIGGGPAGLTAAYELTKLGLAPIVLEKNALVGGLSRTESYKGFHFDMGGHRFFSKSEEVKKFWHEVLGEEFLRRPRLSRIYYKKRFFNYPLKPLNAFLGLGLIESILITCSYLRWRLFPHKVEDTFEQWVTNRFGKRLFETFFKTYTEKVWGISCSELKAEWAAQRIKDLSLKSALLNMFFKPKSVIKTLIEEFDYPRLGPGMMWNSTSRLINERGGTVRKGADVVSIRRQGNRITGVVVAIDGRNEEIAGTDFISSMPVTEFIKKLDPLPPAPVLEAAGKLNYRDFLTVCLIVNRPDLFADNWIYVHDSEAKVGRIQNFKNWSPDMLADQSKSSLGLEYFCSEGDSLWTMSDADLIDLGKRELEKLGLASAADVEDGCVFRVPKSYPVYDSGYKESLAEVRRFVDGLENFQTIGRNGLHRYNNQDHAMLTGMYAVRNMMHGQRYDLWSVNTDQEYHEEARASDEVANQNVVLAVESALARAFPKLDRQAFGLACGAASGLVLFLATIILVMRGGAVVGPHLSLFSQFLPGYDVTALGSLIGLAYGFTIGFLLGWSVALMRNAAVFVYAAAVHRQSEYRILSKLFEHFSTEPTQDVNVSRSAAVDRELKAPEEIVLTRLMRLNAVVSGVVFGLVAGLVLFVATNILVLKGGAVVGPHLSLLSNFFPGYEVTFIGSLIGFAYAFVVGFVVCYLVASVYNLLVNLKGPKGP